MQWRASTDILLLLKDISKRGKTLEIIDANADK